MSVARGSQNGGHFYSNIVMPQEIDLQWVINKADSGGLGITSLKSNGWADYVFMNTSATAGVTNGITNPKPIDGIVVIRLKQNFNVFLGASLNAQATVTGSALTATVNNTPCQIVSLGTATAAQWTAVGLPGGFTAAVGQVFVPTATATIGGSATVKAIGLPAISSFQICGSPAGTISSSSIATYSGAYLVGQFLDFAGALVAPTDNTVVQLKLSFDRSSVSVDGL